MGQRELRRVPKGFDWPLKEVWGGYIQPTNLTEKECASCGGSGYSPFARQMKDRWYGHAPFDPSETGSEPLTVETPEVRAFAERNIANAPWYYGTGEAAIVREARRLSTMWNQMWGHHLDQDDVDALIAEGRLRDFTHRFVRGEGWSRIQPTPTVTAVEVNLWSLCGLCGLGHGSLNSWTVIGAKCEREGQPEACEVCNGHGSVERYPGQRAQAEAWEWTEPPTGDGWQLWETTSEGSPVSPVFETAEELAAWCADNATVFGDSKESYEGWLKMFQTDGGVSAGSTLVGPRPSRVRPSE